jgi:hypothetical protein
MCHIRDKSVAKGGQSPHNIPPYVFVYGKYVYDR